MSLTILPSIAPPPYDEHRRVVIESSIGVIETADSSRAPHLPTFHAEGTQVVHTVHLCGDRRTRAR
ncbi:hypothetical protein A5784_18185 [Mycobacterium sp. 852013-50091_SCH5140682]|nr:hypothetical protein A5784_18185 [Mycobacterium sp. 852013-50091_SCH5140682]